MLLPYWSIWSNVDTWSIFSSFCRCTFYSMAFFARADAVVHILVHCDSFDMMLVTGTYSSAWQCNIRGSPRCKHSLQHQNNSLTIGISLQYSSSFLSMFSTQTNHNNVRLSYSDCVPDHIWPFPLGQIYHLDNLALFIINSDINRHSN